MTLTTKTRHFYASHSDGDIHAEIQGTTGTLHTGKLDIPNYDEFKNQAYVKSPLIDHIRLFESILKR